MKANNTLLSRMGISFILIMLIGASFSLNAGQEALWKLRKEKNGIKVFTRDSDTSLKDSKGTVIVKAEISKVYKLLMNFDRHSRWMYKVRASRILKKISEEEFYIYYEAEAPWPVLDRDIISHYKIKKDENGKIVFQISGEADFIPEKESFVRVPRMEGAWELTPIDKNHVKVVFYNSSDPGGTLPYWLANTTAEDNPYQTLSSFKALLEN